MLSHPEGLELGRAPDGHERKDTPKHFLRLSL